jgi:hypothetical protein
LLQRRIAAIVKWLIQAGFRVAQLLLMVKAITKGAPLGNTADSRVSQYRHALEQKMIWFKTNSVTWL